MRWRSTSPFSRRLCRCTRAACSAVFSPLSLRSIPQHVARLHVLSEEFLKNTIDASLLHLDHTHVPPVVRVHERFYEVSDLNGRGEVRGQVESMWVALTAAGRLFKSTR